MGADSRPVGSAPAGAVVWLTTASPPTSAATRSPPLITSFPGGTDLVVVADLLGHARLDTVRACTRPAEDDRAKALSLLLTDR